MRAKDKSAEELKREWVKKEYRPAYIFYGEDSQAKSLAVDHIKSVLGADEFNLAEFQGDSAGQGAEIVSASATPPMFSDRRLVIVRSYKLPAADKKIVADYLRDPLESTLLLMVSPEPAPDAKDPVASAVRALGGLIVFGEIEGGKARQMLGKEAERLGIELEAGVGSFLTDEVGGEWGLLRSELHKLALFVGSKKKASLEDAALCLGHSRRAGRFEFPNALEKRDTRASLSLLKRLLKEGNDPFLLLNQIKRTVEGQLRIGRIKAAKVAPADAAKILRTSERAAAFRMRNAPDSPETHWVAGLDACIDTETALKTGSSRDKTVALEELVLRVCKGS